MLLGGKGSRGDCPVEGAGGGGGAGVHVHARAVGGLLGDGGCAGCCARCGLRCGLQELRACAAVGRKGHILVCASGGSDGCW